MPKLASSSLTPLFVLTVSLAATALVTLAVERTIHVRDRARFDNQVLGARDRIRTRLSAYEATLLAGTGLFASHSEGVYDEEFGRFVEALELPKNYPGIQGIGFSRRLSAAQLEPFLAGVRAAGRPDFRLWPEGPRAEYHVIEFLYPRDARNQAALGFDMFTEPTRRAAMERARDGNAPAASGKVTLVQEIDEKKQAGFLIYAPVYAKGPSPGTVEERRRTLVGFVYSPFRADDLFEGIFGSELPRLAFAVYDGDEVSDRALLHRSERSDEPSGYRPAFEERMTLPVAGHRWTIAFHTRPAFDRASPKSVVPVVLMIGLLVSGLLFWATRAQLRSHQAALGARAEAEAQRNNLYRLLMQAPAAIAIIRGPDFRYELSNPLNQALTGGRAVSGARIKDCLPELEAAGLLAVLDRVYRSGEPVNGSEVPVTAQGPDGREKVSYLNGTYQPLRGPDGAIEGVMVFAYEVTDLVTARHKVEALADDLQRAVGARDDFLSVAGHELKTPLAALMLQLQSLILRLERAPETDLPQLKERLAKAVNHVRRLQLLVGEVLDVSRIAAGRLQMRLEETDLVEVARDVTERFAEQLLKAGCSLRLDAPPVLLGRWDRVRVDQVLTNLLANAIKYGPGRPVEVMLRAGAGQAVLEVTDHGIGIPAEDQERIFGRFERAVSERHYGGLGLGLWISRQIVEAMSGTISCVSAPGQGSTFTVQLPLEPLPAEAHQTH